ncbi:MAG: hypothetical protein ABIY51_13050 [Ferruginibacter sp.]
MINNSIVQFVCFITQLKPESFAPDWEHYAQTLANKKTELFLFEQMTESKNKFRYISQHVWPEADFNHLLANEKPSKYFQEYAVKIVQAGGYMPLVNKKKHNHSNNEVKLVAFLNHDEYDLTFFRELPMYNSLKEYQAYYESCTYGNVLEYSVAEKDANELLQLIQQKPSVEVGLYKECFVPHTERLSIF